MAAFVAAAGRAGVMVDPVHVEAQRLCRILRKELHAVEHWLGDAKPSTPGIACELARRRDHLEQAVLELAGLGIPQGRRRLQQTRKVVLIRIVHGAARHYTGPLPPGSCNPADTSVTYPADYPGTLIRTISLSLDSYLEIDAGLAHRIRSRRGKVIRALVEAASILIVHRVHLGKHRTSYLGSLATGISTAGIASSCSVKSLHDLLKKFPHEKF